MFTFVREIALLRMMPFFLLGIIVAVFLQTEWLNQFFGFALLISYLLFFVYQLFIRKQYPLRWINGVFILINGFLLGYAITYFHTDRNFKTHYSHHLNDTSEKLVQISIEEAPVVKKNSYKFIAELHAIDTIPVDGQLLFYVEDSLGALLDYGDEMILNIQLSALQEPLNPAQFDYAEFMSFRQIHHQAYFTAAQVLQWTTKERYTSIYYWSIHLREWLSNRLQKAIEDQEAFEVAAALLLGYREKLQAETIRAYSASGAMHVLAVSGLHVGIFYWLLNQLLFFLDRKKSHRHIKIILLIVIIWSYAFVTGLSPSIQRAALMFSLVGIAQNIKRSNSIYNAIVVSAFILLCINPYLLMEVGFQLSYAALLGIIAFQPLLYRQLYIENKILDWIWSITCVSIAAQWATFPIGLLYFHQFPIYFMVSNLVVIPAATVLLPLGIFYFALAGVPVLGLIIGQFLEWGFQLLNFLVFHIENLPGSLLIGFSPTVFETWLCYCIVISSLALYHYRKKWLLKAPALVLVLLLAFFNVKSWQHTHKKELTVYAINNASAIDINWGTEQAFIADSALIGDEDQMLFSVIHNWWRKGYTRNDTVLTFEESVQGNAFFYSKQLLQVGEKLICIVDGQQEFNDQADSVLAKHADLILIKNNPYPVLDHLDIFPANTPLLIDGSNHFYFREKFWQKAIEKGLNAHDLMKEGAFIYPL